MRRFTVFRARALARYCWALPGLRLALLGALLAGLFDTCTTGRYTQWLPAAPAPTLARP